MVFSGSHIASGFIGILSANFAGGGAHDPLTAEICLFTYLEELLSLSIYLLIESSVVLFT